MWYAFKGDFTHNSAVLDMDKANPSNLARQSRVEQIIERARQIYEIGVQAKKHLKKNPHLTEFGKKQTIGPDAVCKAWLLAREYRRADLQKFLKRRTPDGMPLTWRHAVELARVKDRRTREMLQRRAADEGWTQSQLVQARQLQTGINRGYAGRKVKGPASVELVLQQLAAETLTWSHKWEQIWSPRLRAGSLFDHRRTTDGAQVQALLKRSRVALTEMQKGVEQAEKHLGRQS